MLIHSKPTLTVFSDASILPKQQSAGWAGWVKEDGCASSVYSGHAEYHKDSSVVEAYAMYKTLLAHHAYGRVAKHKSVILQCDNLRVLQCLRALVRNSYVSAHKEHRSVPFTAARSVDGPIKWSIRGIAELLTDAEVVYLRHVKGHQRGVNTRSWVNELCDKHAKQAAKLP